MKKRITMTMGMDLGDRHSTYVVLDEAGDVVNQGRVPTTKRGLQTVLGGRVRMRVVMEVGAQSRWVSRFVERLGHEVVVANPRKLRLIYENPGKSDAVDAEYLARVGRLDVALLSPVEHRGEEAAKDLQVLRTREQLVQTRTKLINHVRGSVKTTGGRLGKYSAGSFAKQASTELGAEQEEVLGPVLGLIQMLTDEIRDYDGKIEGLCEKYPETELVMQIRGVGPVTGLAFVLTLEAPERFGQSRAVGAYVGLCPKNHQSGEQDRQLGISKAGDPFLRRLLVQSAHYILGPFGEECDLRAYGERIAARGGKAAKKRAAVAVARKLAVLMHHLWRHGEVYDPHYQSQAA